MTEAELQAVIQRAHDEGKREGTTETRLLTLETKMSRLDENMNKLLWGLLGTFVSCIGTMALLLYQIISHAASPGVHP